MVVNYEVRNKVIKLTRFIARQIALIYIVESCQVELAETGLLSTNLSSTSLSAGKGRLRQIYS